MALVDGMTHPQRTPAVPHEFFLCIWTFKTNVIPAVRALNLDHN